MMALIEALLPSEIARLVYGYLVYEKCTETAQSFLNESASLHECRSVLSHGRSFTTRVNGYALKDILENFCAVNSVVQDKVNQLNNSDDLKHCYDLVDQIRFILEDCKKQIEVVKVDASTQVTPINLSVSLGKSGNGYTCLTNDRESSIQRFDRSIQTETFSFCEPNAVETTLLTNLPGYVNYSESRKFQTKISEESKNTGSQNINFHETQNRKIIHKNFKQYTNSAIQTSTIERCERLDKNVMTDIVERKLNNFKDIEVQTCEIGSPDSGVLSSAELLGDITSELLNRSEMQERIAVNINKILESKKFVYFSNMSTEGTKDESSKSFIAEFNKTVETAFNKTENDPDILDLVNEIIHPADEVVNTEDEIDMEVDSSVDEFQENMDIDFEETTSKLKNNQETILVENKQIQTKILKEQNVNNEICNTLITKNNQAQIEFDPSHSTKCIDQVLVEKLNVNKENLKVPKHTQNNLEKIESSSLNLAISQELLPKPVTTSDNFFTHDSTITSTPLKTYTAVQGFDTCDWLFTQTLPNPEIDCHKDSLFKTNQYTVSETVATTTSLISPITSKDISSIAEKVNATSDFTANALKDKVLNTPDIIFPSNNNIPSFNDPVFSKSFPPSKDSEIQKDFEIKNNLPDLHSVQKFNRTADNSLCLSNEKLFGSESIMLYGMENNVTTLPTLVTIPEIEFEDSLTVTGTGLSPFIKRDKVSKNTEPEKSNPVKTDDISNETLNKPIDISKKKQEPTESIIKTSSNILEAVTKSTPNVLKENRSKSNRLSLSTPKKPSNHVRALNFETPAPRSQSESKANEKITGRSPESVLKELKNACKSSLFQSPEITNVDIIEQNNFSSENGGEIENLKNLKDEKIVNNEAKQTISKNVSVSSQSDTIKVEPIKKKSWDEDLRSMCGQNVVQEQEPLTKSKRKRKSKNSEKNEDKRDSKKSNKKDKSTSKKLKNKDESTSKKSKKTDKKTPKKSKINDKKTPNKSKKSHKSEQHNVEKKLNPTETKIDINNAEEMLEVSNILRDKPADPKSSKESPTVSNGSKSMPIVSKGAEEMFIISNTSKETSVVENYSEKTFVVENNSEEMSKDPNVNKHFKQKQEDVIQNNLKSEISKTKNADMLSTSALEAWLSNSINEEDAIDTTDVMKLAAEEMNNLCKLNQNKSACNLIVNTNQDIAEKMHFDEELMSATFEPASQNVDNKKIKQPQDIKNFGDYKKLDNHLSAQELNVTPPFSNTSIITTITSGSSQKAEVIYDKVSKIERGRLVQKKYARLQTLDTKIVPKSEINSFTTEVTTLQKDENTSSLTIPPTPRVLSPGNSCSFLTMPTSKLGDESQMRSIRCFVKTPTECPRTPEIVLTPPKNRNESTTEAAKDVRENGASSCFQSTFPTFESLKKSEITQFEVIKENLKDAMPKIQTQPDQKMNDVTKIQIISKNKAGNDMKPIDEIEAVPRHQQCTVSSSSCSSISCSCCTLSLMSAPENYVNNNNDIESNYKNTNNRKDSSNNFKIKIEESKMKIATSPVKVFSISKTNQELAKTIKATPVKDDDAALEMKIVETPNISKLADNPTNLNNKISQMINIKDTAQLEKTQVTENESIEHILPQIVTKASSQFGKGSPLNMQRQAHEVQDESKDSNSLFQRIKIKKSEEEVTQAVESITVNSNFKFNKNLEKNSESTESATSSPESKFNNLDNTQNKVQLMKAIQSITGEIDSPAYSPIKKLNTLDEEEQSSCSEINHSKIEYCECSDDSQEFLISKSKEKAAVDLTNINASNQELYFYYDDSIRKRRRKKVNQEDLKINIEFDQGYVINYRTCWASKFECLFNLPPVRKNAKKKPSSTTSSVFSSSSSNQKNDEKFNTKRKRSGNIVQEAANKKRLKNLDFDEF